MTSAFLWESGSRGQISRSAFVDVVYVSAAVCGFCTDRQQPHFLRTAAD